MKYSLSRLCGECERDFVEGQIVNFVAIENQSFCDSCISTIDAKSERRVIPSEGKRQELLG